MKKKLLSLISTVLCLCVVLSACGGPANSDPSSSASESQSGDNTQDKTLTIATMTETTTLSPLYMGVYNYSMCTMLYETLLKYEDGEVKGNLAESYSFNEDGTVMTLTLRQGITFHDGTPFNAEAVKKNLDFMHSNPQYMACPVIYDIESVEATDEYTVTITYPHPYYGYAYDFCWPDVGGMQSPNQIVEGDFQTVQGYVGTGPYIYEEYVPGEYTRFVRNENYWGEEPYFDEIIARYIPDSTSRLQALQTGEIDLVYGSSMISYQDYQQATALNGVSGAIAEKDTRARDITLNASSGPLVDAQVRQAVSHAINKEEFSDGLTYGYERIAEMPFPEGTPYTDIELTESYPYDPEKAAALLDEAGWVMNEETGIREKDGETLNLTFIYDTAQDSLVSSYATLLKSQLEKVGIGLELKGSEKMEWYAEMMAGNFDITYWIGEYEFSSPHCFFGAMPSMTPHTFSLSQVDGSQEFFDAITAVKQTDDSHEVQELYNYLINYDLGSPIQLLAQVADMKTYRIVFVSCGEIAPDLFVNLCIGQHTAFIGGQQQENPIFFCGKLNLLSIPNDLSSAWKDLKNRERHHRFLINLEFFYLRVVFEDRQDLLQNFRISFVQLQNHDSSDDITAFPLSLRVAFSRSKVSLLTTCSIRQASRSAVTGSTPAATSISVKKRCFS